MLEAATLLWRKINADMKITMNIKALLASLAFLVAMLSACAPTAQSGSVNQDNFFNEPYSGRVETLALVLDVRSTDFRRDSESTLYDSALFALLSHPYAYQRFDLVERGRIDALVAEFDLARSGLVDASTAARIGRLLGAESIIIMSVSGVTATPFGASVAGIGASVFDVRASIQMRMIDVETGRIFAAVQKQMQQVVPGSFRYNNIGFAGDARDAAILTVINRGAVLAIDDLMRAIGQ